MSAGAKLYYIRLLVFAGKDARCYPSLQRLGTSLGVSERRARDYVKKLERSGFIVVEQRGLRKTNAYLFVWTAELERLSGAVPESADDPDEPDEGTPQGSPPDRYDCSGQDRKHGSAPDRNSSSGQDRNFPSGPIGINSSGISSVESSSSSGADDAAKLMTKTTTRGQSNEETSQLPQTINCWARERGIQRLRSDRGIGPSQKGRIRTQLGEIPFRNWFDFTRQVERRGDRITIAVSNEPSRFFLETEYGTVTRAALAELGIQEIQFTVGAPATDLDQTIGGHAPRQNS